MLSSLTLFGAITRRISFVPPWPYSAWLWSTGAAQAIATPRRKGKRLIDDAAGQNPEWDLIRDEATVVRAGGRLMHLFGQVMNFDGAPMPNVTVEIWQSECNCSRPAFLGSGAVRTDRFSGYRFRTMLPQGDPSCPPFIDARLTPLRGRPLSTRLYLLDDPRNERDWHFAALGPSRQAAVTLDPVKRADGNLEAGFNFVL